MEPKTETKTTSLVLARRLMRGALKTAKMTGKRYYRAQNRQRAARVEAILRKAPYSAGTEGVETALIDLLSDARHLCDLHGIPWHEADRDAYKHYSAEIVEARTGQEQ